MYLRELERERERGGGRAKEINHNFILIAKNIKTLFYIFRSHKYNPLTIEIYFYYYSFVDIFTSRIKFKL